MPRKEPDQACCDGAYFLADTFARATEYGICLLDEAFDPYTLVRTGDEPLSDGTERAGQMDVVMKTDLDGTIVEVNDAWDRFAVENSGAHLVSDKVVGKSLWSFISDPPTRRIHQELAKACAETGTGRTVHLRCDAPTKIRHITMDMGCPDGACIVYQSRVTREIGTRNIALLDVAVPRNDSILIMCSWCKGIEYEGAWLELADAVNRLGLFDLRVLPRIFHSVCERCLENAKSRLGTFSTDEPASRCCPPA